MGHVFDFPWLAAAAGGDLWLGEDCLTKVNYWPGRWAQTTTGRDNLLDQMIYHYAICTDSIVVDHLI